MKVKMYGYTKCSTCQKSMKWVESFGVEVDCHDFVLNPISKENIKEIVEMSELPLRRFFNTSGLKYKELGLASKMDTLTDEEKYDLLASDGMLIKRPILVCKGKSIPGFREDEWKALLGVE